MPDARCPPNPRPMSHAQPTSHESRFGPQPTSHESHQYVPSTTRNRNDGRAALRPGSRSLLIEHFLIEGIVSVGVVSEEAPWGRFSLRSELYG